MDSSDGQKATIRFTNAKPAMELKSVWHAHRPRAHSPHHVHHQQYRPADHDLEQETFDLHVVGPKADTELRGPREDFEDGSNAGVEKTGRELAAGINMTLKGEPASELMFFEEIALEKPE